MNDNLSRKPLPKRKNNVKKGMSIGLIASALILAGFLGSYAFFQASGVSQNENISAQTGNIELIFSDGTPGFLKELEFGSSAEKTFTIKNNGSVETIAKINWKNLVNTYIKESLTYSLRYTDEENNTQEVIINENIPRSETHTTLELANGISIPSGKTYTLTLTITLNYLESTDQTADLNAKFSSEFSIEEGDRNLVKTLLAKTNAATITDYNSGVKEEMYTFSHPATEQTEALTDYRYIGKTPNNYIKFNNETWRIIGVFTVEGENEEKEQRVKIIRNESIGKFAWDSNNINEWPTSSLSKLLNIGDYYTRNGTCETTGLINTAKSQIVPTKWYLGGSSEYKNFDASDYYNFERGMETCITTGICSEEMRSVNIIQNVGLLYLSDYIYTYANGIDSTCFTNAYNCDRGNPTKGWIFSSSDEWSISPSSSTIKKVFDLRASGFVSFNGTDLSVVSNTRPCVYLRSDILISSGDGSSQKPYKLKETVE